MTAILTFEMPDKVWAQCSHRHAQDMRPDRPSAARAIDHGFGVRAKHGDDEAQSRLFA
jgi:hypothetical protein